MRILVLSNLYPPYYIGGYELGCRDVVDQLRDRGHTVRVLTSSYGVKADRPEHEVYRELDFQDARLPSKKRLCQRVSLEVKNNRILKRHIDWFEPDVITVWSMWRLPRSLLFSITKCGLPVVYAVSSPWLMEFIQTEQRLRECRQRVLKGKLKFVLGLMFTGVLGTPTTFNTRINPKDVAHGWAFFTSRALLEAHRSVGLSFQRTRVIYWGIPSGAYYGRINRAERPDRVPHLLLVGRISPQKGLHTAIEAMDILVHCKGHQELCLDIVGLPDVSVYMEKLREMIYRYGLEANVHFCKPVPREEMPDVYARYSILLFPSIWEEPFSIALLEAMASGIAVIGTLTGGSKEILVHGENALVFEPENAADLAAQIAQLLESPKLQRHLSENASRLVRERFDIERMVDEVEAYIQEAVQDWYGGG